jgi:thiamine-monophosphate kinase
VINPTIADLGEHALIARITRRIASPRWAVIGAGDDAAVVKPPRGALEVLTTDALVEGVHFDHAFVPPRAIGQRAVAANVSDLAAMGATPRGLLLSLALPASLALDVLDGIVDGFLDAATAEAAALIGGNITRTTGPCVINVAAIGSVHRRGVLARSGARAGDGVYVTGHLGAAAVGLASLRAGVDATNDAGLRACQERYLFPVARTRAGLQLSHYGAAASAIDLSDGLADGLHRLAEASGVGMMIEADALPLASGVAAWHAAHGGAAVTTALSGGDDYELLFTVRPRHGGRLRGAIRRLGELPITRIGVVTEDRAVLVRDANGVVPIGGGFEHFR